MSAPRSDAVAPFWARPADEHFVHLACSRDGLSEQEARARLGRYGRNDEHKERRFSLSVQLGKRVIEPLSLVLLFAAGISAATGDGAGG